MSQGTFRLDLKPCAQNLKVTVIIITEVALSLSDIAVISQSCPSAVSSAYHHVQVPQRTRTSQRCSINSSNVSRVAAASAAAPAAGFQADNSMASLLIATSEAMALRSVRSPALPG
jgi:hypothetical protein